MRGEADDGAAASGFRADLTSYARRFSVRCRTNRDWIAARRLQPEFSSDPVAVLPQSLVDPLPIEGGQNHDDGKPRLNQFVGLSRCLGRQIDGESMPRDLLED